MMKKAVRLILAVILMLAMAVPCYAAANYSFRAGETEITVGNDAEAVLDDLGKANKVYETDSFVYAGKNIVYAYNDFELSISPDGISNRIVDIYIPSGSAASTPEGLHIGSTKDDMVRLYGSKFTESGDVCQYTRGESLLLVYLKGGKVSTIEYQLAAE